MWRGRTPPTALSVKKTVPEQGDTDSSPYEIRRPTQSRGLIPFTLEQPCTQIGVSYISIQEHVDRFLRPRKDVVDNFLR